MRNNFWNDEEIKKLKSYSSMSKDDIIAFSKEMNRSFESVDHQRRRYGILITEEIQENKKSSIQTNKDLIHELTERLRKVSQLEPRLKIKNIKIIGDTLVIQFTDWHVGKTVKDEEGNELYNTRIFKCRIKILLEEILMLLDEYIIKGTLIKDVVIISTGDILDGMGIYSTQESQSEISPPFQVMMAVNIIQEFILALVSRKLTVRFYGVKGNHGEIRGEGGKQKDPNANWDLMLYLILDWWVKDIKTDKVEIHYSELDYLNFEIQGWRYHIRHIAPQQADTPSGKSKFLGWGKKHKIDALVYGHYHHWMITDRSGITVFRGGSVCGQDDLSELMAEESEPIQLIWGVSKHRPNTFMYAIDLGERLRLIDK